MWSLKKLEKFLTDNGVDISRWGKGSSKTLNHLLQELIKEECELKIRDDGKVIRIVHALSITVLYKGEVLKEEYQKFKDGRIRKRKLDCSVAEKIHKSEIKDLNQAVKRALSEELRINDISSDQINGSTNRFKTKASPDYPGTDMDLILYRFDVLLKYHQYDPYGYVEHQDDKDIYFVWMKNKMLKSHGWIGEGLRSNKSQRKNLNDIQKLKKEIKLIEPVLTDLNYDIMYTTTPWTNGDFSLTISMYDKEASPKSFKPTRIPQRNNSDEYEEFKDRLFDLCDENGYKCDVFGKFGTYFEMKRKNPHVLENKNILESKYKNVILERNAKLCNVRDEIKNISHVLNDVGVRIKAHLCQISDGEFICLRLLKLDSVYGWIQTIQIWEMEECDEFLDRLNDICEKNGLSYLPSRPHGSFLMIGEKSFDLERILKSGLLFANDNNNIFFDSDDLKEISESKKIGFKKNSLKDLIKICNEIKTITHILTDVGLKVNCGIYCDRINIGFYIYLEISKQKSKWWDTNFDTMSDINDEYGEFRERLSEICKNLYICCNKTGEIIISQSSNMNNRIYIERNPKDYISIIGD